MDLRTYTGFTEPVAPQDGYEDIAEKLTDDRPRSHVVLKLDQNTFFVSVYDEDIDILFIMKR